MKTRVDTHLESFMVVFCECDYGSRHLNDVHGTTTEPRFAKDVKKALLGDQSANSSRIAKHLVETDNHSVHRDRSKRNGRSRSECSAVQDGVEPHLSSVFYQIEVGFVTGNIGLASECQK